MLLVPLMKTLRIALMAAPILVLTHSAFADSEDKKKTTTTEPQAPTEEPAAQTTMTPEPTPQPPPAPAPAPPPAPPPQVSTTQITFAPAPMETAEHRPVEKNPVANRATIEPEIGYGTNAFNLGIGGRIGYTFEIPIYVGGTFMWYNGDTQTTTGAGGVTQSRQRNYWYPGGELGFDIGNKSFMVRPYVGGAALYDRSHIDVNGVASATTTAAQFMFYPGLTARYNVAEGPFYVGADTRLLVPVDHGPASYQAFGVLGVSP
jgi:hypothetical protein